MQEIEIERQYRGFNAWEGEKHWGAAGGGSLYTWSNSAGGVLIGLLGVIIFSHGLIYPKYNMYFIALVPGLTRRWGGWRMRWTSSGANSSTESQDRSRRPGPGTAPLWIPSSFTPYSKTVYSSSESSTTVDGKEVEGSKTSYSARFQQLCVCFCPLLFSFFVATD